MLRGLGLAVMLVAAQMAPGAAAELSVTLHGPAGVQGEMMVALAASPAEFPGHASRFAHAPAGTVVRFEGLKPGDYAIAAFEDVNGNGVLDKDALGIPSEAYGFSNDARGWFGPPGWEAARFHLGPEGGAVVIELR